MDKKDGDYIEGWKWTEMFTSLRPAGEGRISSHLEYRMVKKDGKEWILFW